MLFFRAQSTKAFVQVEKVEKQCRAMRKLLSMKSAHINQADCRADTAAKGHLCGKVQFIWVKI